MSLVNKIIIKCKFKEALRNSSTFQTEREISKFVSIPYEPRIIRGLSTIFKNLDMTVVYSSGNKLQQLLGNAKNKIELNEWSGIYEINC